jgi:predicted metal-dependent hydrolase
MAGWELSTRIAFSAAFEYLTALLSEEVLRPRGAWLDENTTQQVRLWRWHCEEEINHRHVAQDVADAMDVGQGRHALIFLAAAFYLCADLAVALAALLISDVRARRVGMARVLMQAAGFGVRVLPSVLRMAGKSVRHLVGTRRRR